MRVVQFICRLDIANLLYHAYHGCKDLGCCALLIHPVYFNREILLDKGPLH